MICVSSVGRAEGSRAAAAALACAAAEDGAAALLVELREDRSPRPTLVASAAARRLEERLTAHLPEAGVASRGRLCHLVLPAGPDGVAMLAGAAAVGRDSTCVLHAPSSLVRPLLDAPGLAPAGALLRADLGEDRALTALVARDLIARGLRVAVLKQPLGWVAGRLALAGALPVGGLPPRLVDRLASPPSHPCYSNRNGSKSDSAGVAERKRGDHEGAGSR